MSAAISIQEPHRALGGEIWRVGIGINDISGMRAFEHLGGAS
jgi:hypothetical protein